MQCFPNRFITVARFDFENFPWPTLKVFPAENKVISEKKRSSPKFKRFFRPRTGYLPETKTSNTTFQKYDFYQNALWPFAKCSVAHRWAMAHRLKSTDLMH